MNFVPTYAKAVSEIIPDAIIVIDKFHVMQEINRRLDNVRKDLQSKYRMQGVDIRRFKKSRLIFMTNWEYLTISSTEMLDRWFNEFPELYEAYMCKETFRDIYLTAETYEEASKLYDFWIDAIPDFEQFAPMKKTMTSYREHILNYWHFQWVNAYTESVNNLIKGVEKAGRGYKFNTLREMCLLEINSPKPNKLNPRTAEYKPSSELRANTAEAIEKSPLYWKLYSDNIDFNICSLKEHLALYLEFNSSERRSDSFAKRMTAYYEKLRFRNP